MTETSTKLLPILALLPLVCLPTLAQADDPAFSRLVPYGRLQAQFNEQVLDDGEIFFAERPGAYLLRATGLPQPLLINVRSQRVERLNAEAIRDHGDGTLSLLPGAVVAEIGPFQVEGSQLSAALDGGNRLVLGPKPDLLGRRTSAEVVAHDTSYRYRAGLYPPSEKTIARLRQEQRPVTVTVYFGSWCSACSRVLPWLMAVEQALEGSSIAFDYYGLPHTMDDPAAREAGVQAVPTAVVRSGGKELGRRTSTGLGVPEDALLEILSAR